MSDAHVGAGVVGVDVGGDVGVAVGATVFEEILTREHEDIFTLVVAAVVFEREDAHKPV